MGPELDFDIEDPELEYEDGSEIAAAVDVSIHGTDQIFRPIYINQEDAILSLTLADAKRLLGFLNKAVKFVEDFETRVIQ